VRHHFHHATQSIPRIHTFNGYILTPAAGAAPLSVQTADAFNAPAPLFHMQGDEDMLRSGACCAIPLLK
jgi:hypothetical protein